MKITNLYAGFMSLDIWKKVSMLGTIFGVMLAGFGVALVVLPHLHTKTIPVHIAEEDVPIQEQASSSAFLTSTQEMIVFVSGAVKKPGIVHLEKGHRVAEAIQSAGGLTNQADRAWVDKNLNLSKKVQDEMQIYVPPLGVSKTTEAEAGGGGKVNLNTASMNELMTLKGIGEARAQAIVDHRPYTSFDDFQLRAGIPQTTIDAVLGNLAL